MRDLHTRNFPKRGDRLQPLGCSQGLAVMVYKEEW